MAKNFKERIEGILHTSLRKCFYEAKIEVSEDNKNLNIQEGEVYDFGSWC